MLGSLRVRDLAVLEDVAVSFGEGLTVLTGETGAGKSLVVDALSLLSGERADASLVRAGADRLVVEGAFTTDDPAVSAALREAGLDEQEDEARRAVEVVVRREVSPGGKGRLFVSGSPAALRTLAEIAPRLLVLHGQAEARDLLDPSAPRELLDRFAGLGAAAEETAAAHARWREAEGDRERLAAAAKDRETRLALLEALVGEIDAVAPREGEEETLAAEKAVLSNVEKVGRLLLDATTALESEEGGALPAVNAARRALLSLAELDPSWEARAAEAGEISERLSDLALAAARALERLEADPGRLAAVAERLDALAKLKRKHGGSLAEVLARRETLGRERDELADLSGALAKARARAQAAFDDFRARALELSAARGAAAPRFSSAVVAHLQDLAFLSASFTAGVARRPAPESPFFAGDEPVAFSAAGIDQVTFQFAPNPGEPPRPLAKIASGGELSRVQLAVAAALAEEETRLEKGKARKARRYGPVRTFVFDEVDAGVSGATAEAVGRKLRALASRDQVLVVTHLPQVAAAGEHHLVVEKDAAGGRTRTRVTHLGPKERVEAIAALLGGAKVGDAARAQARQLLAAYR